MRKWAIIIAIIGLGILLAMLFNNPVKISSLEKMRAGTLVSLQGTVSKEKESSFGKTFSIDNIPVFCECKKVYANKKVSAIGIVEDYYELRVRVLEIKIIDS